MEYGDLSSLVVEYPDYNSLGLQLLQVSKFATQSYSIDSKKIKEDLSLPVAALSELAGRAVIITLKGGDLVAFGILVNETQSHSSSIPRSEGVAMCENVQSTLKYRAFFQLMQEQSNGEGASVSFNGMLRTSARMNSDDELIISINGKQKFDIDFENAYGNKS
jgi:hypothetical protein